VFYQLIVVNFWQFLNASERQTAYTRATFLFCFGIIGFLIHNLDHERLQWSLLDITSAATYACINHYLHHYVQRYVDGSQYLQSEIYACGSLVVLLAPFAWLEFNTINLPDVNTSFVIVTIVFLCGLLLGYRRSGLLFNSLTQTNTAMFFITTTTFAVVITGFKVISPLLVISLILMAASAYWSSLDPPQPDGSRKSYGKLYMLLFFCMVLLLFQCTIVVLNNAVTFVPPATVQTNIASGLPPIRLDPEFEFNRLICLRKVRERGLHEVGSRIRDGEPVSFMDLPMHSNLGDVFIWQGTQGVLEARGQFPLVSDNRLERNIAKILPVSFGILAEFVYEGEN
jgi:hypothetical protein